MQLSILTLLLNIPRKKNLFHELKIVNNKKVRTIRDVRQKETHLLKAILNYRITLLS